MANHRVYYSVLALSVALLAFPVTAMAETKKSVTATEIALYNGTDRQKVLEEGAKKEGKLTFYTSGVMTGWVRELVDAFERRYPFVKVELWGASSREIIARTSEEYKAAKYVVDVQNFAHSAQVVAEEIGLLQPYSSPSFDGIKEEGIRRASGGGAMSAVFYEVGYALGYNTNLMSKEILPKQYQDFLAPKWKGKLPITATGVDWMGSVLVNHGEEFLRQLAKQELRVHTINNFSLLQLIITGEYPLSFVISDTHVMISREKGAPVEWVPLEPVQISAGMVALAKNPPHPHASLLFIDFILSKEAAERVFKTNHYNSARKDVGDQRTYKKFYGAKSSKEYMEWSNLFNKWFLKK